MIDNDSNKPLTNVCNRNVDNNKGCELVFTEYMLYLEMLPS